jgi:hypothetical protein
VDNKESASISQLAAAWRDALFGAAAVREPAPGAVNIASENPDTQEFCALVLPAGGDVKRAELLTQGSIKRFPFHTAVQSYWLPHEQGTNRSGQPSNLSKLLISRKQRFR